MACFRPMVAHRTRSRTQSGKFRMKFLCRATSFSDRWGPDLMLLPCRQCIGCRLEQSRQAATRLIHELKFHPFSGFLTLTYDDKHLPKGGSLDPARWTKFMRDFRAHVSYRCPLHGPSGEGVCNCKVKAFGVGEYGEAKGRPHYHAILFSDFALYGPGFEEVEASRSGERQWVSPEVSSVWKDGRHRISEVTFESAAYVARYCLKKVNGPGESGHYLGRAKEFVRWPKGLGKLHFEKWSSDIYPSDQVVLPGRGKFLPPPYYDRLLERLDPEFFAKIKLVRSERHDNVASEAEWFGLIEEKERSERVQRLRQARFAPRGVE